MDVIIKKSPWFTSNAECLVALYVKRQPQFLSKVQKLFSSVRGRGGSLSERFSTFNNIRRMSSKQGLLQSSYQVWKRLKKASVFNTSRTFRVLILASKSTKKDTLHNAECLIALILFFLPIRPTSEVKRFCPFHRE